LVIGGTRTGAAHYIASKGIHEVSLTTT
jgi:hypothetical protein